MELFWVGCNELPLAQMSLVIFLRYDLVGSMHDRNVCMWSMGRHC